MRNRSKRRPPPRRRRTARPHEQAKVDQIMAAVRDRATAEPTTRFHVVEYADPGIQCCWCDCPVDEHQTSGYICAGCPEDGVYVIHGMPEEPGDSAYPLCERHRWGLAELYRERFPEKRVEVFGYDAYDKDSDSSGMYEEP